MVEQITEWLIGASLLAMFALGVLVIWMWFTRI